MCDKKIGGSYSCRICGDIHGCFPCNQEVLPLQAVQISIENIEDFFSNSSMSIETRKTFEEAFEDLRILLGVPKEKIYNRESLLGTDKLDEAFYEFNPKPNFLENALVIISRIGDFAINYVYGTKSQGETMMSVISSLKNEVSKK